jgi:hypothetical protein
MSDITIAFGKHLDYLFHFAGQDQYDAGKVNTYPLHLLVLRPLYIVLHYCWLIGSKTLPVLGSTLLYF